MRILRGFNPIYKLHACTRALEYYVDDSCSSWR